MSFLRAARAALASQILRWTLGTAAAVLAALSLSCGGSSSSIKGTVPDHNAYVTLPNNGSILSLNISGSTGQITLGAKTPPAQGFTPTGLVLLPSKKFLYAINSQNYSISIFSVAADGTLSLTGAPTPAGAGPNSAVIDPTGSFLLVTNAFSDNVSVFSIDSSSGALTEVSGSPFYANKNPTQIAFSHSGQFVYVVNPSIGTITGFAFDPTATEVLTPVPGSPAPSGAGAAALAVDGDRFVYVVNPSAINPAPYASTPGNISAFSIDSITGELTPVAGSPFTSVVGSMGPTAITVDPSGSLVYATTPGSSYSVWCFTIDQSSGQLAPVMNSPFSVSAGGQFVLIDPIGEFLYIGNEAGTAIAGYTFDEANGALTVLDNSPYSTNFAPGSMVFLE
jgi:6-phosphogluconolactonase